MSEFPCDLLMVIPQYFKIDYEINPYMLDSKGELNQVNADTAMTQWLNLYEKFNLLNLRVKKIPGVEGLPDMVFAANQSFPFLRGNRPFLLMSKMKSSYRRDEVDSFRHWAISNDIGVVELEHGGPFEGTGDLITDPYNKIVFGGFGFRTEQSVYEEISNIIERPILQLELVSPYFYHLDTCLSIINQDCALYVKDAFNDDGVTLIKSHYSKAYEIPLDDARKNFLGNCFSPDGTHLIIQHSDSALKEKLTQDGLRLVEVDTSEFIKSGGSVFCMKLALMHGI